MKPILMSLGVMIVCLVVLVISQLVDPPRAIANNLMTIQPSDSVSTSINPASLAQANLLTPNQSQSNTMTDNQITTKSGLQYVDLIEGKGASPTTGNLVTVHYTGTLTDGTQFDSSRDWGTPFKFKIGIGQVIKGWDEGVASMKVGGRRKLTIPSALGYGSRGAGGVIPPNATLIFDVELIAVQ
ncbi:MAG: FKBP-type peptidyl-prolyl cis-trans isomerase [Cyanobacteria bacterium LVE1205-1]